MKKFWFKVTKWDKNLVTLAIESGFDTFCVNAEDVEKIRKLAKVTVISTSKDADMQIGKDVAEVLISSKEKEADVVKLNGKIPTIISNDDWTIIPLENLISKTTNLIQTVASAKEAKLALETMEKGADGILLDTTDLYQIKETGELLQTVENENLELVEATIVATEHIGMGDRVVIDTSTLLAPGKGMLVGDSSSAMFLVYNENVQSPYCDARPFRVNAGGVHAYIRMPNDKTKYIAELHSGSQVLVVDPKGNTEKAIVGRVKIEKRPMLLVTAMYKEKRITLVMQNAETIRLTNIKGEPTSITKLKAGDKVLAYIQEAGVGRHFGTKVKETITEK